MISGLAIGFGIGVLLGFFLAALLASAKAGDAQMYQDRCEYLDGRLAEARRDCFCGAVEDAA